MGLLSFIYLLAFAPGYPLRGPNGRRLPAPAGLLAFNGQSHAPDQGSSAGLCNQEWPWRSSHGHLRTCPFLPGETMQLCGTAPSEDAGARFVFTLWSLLCSAPHHPPTSPSQASSRGRGLLYVQQVDISPSTWSSLKGSSEALHEMVMDFKEI